MTLEEFLSAWKEAAKNLGRVEMVTRGDQDQIRVMDHRGLEFCPLTAVCYHRRGEYHSPDHYGRAGDALEIDPYVRSAIVDAADGSLGGERSPIRRDLLAAVPLVEVAAEEPEPEAV